MKYEISNMTITNTRVVLQPKLLKLQIVIQNIAFGASM